MNKKLSRCAATGFALWLFAVPALAGERQGSVLVSCVLSTPVASAAWQKWQIELDDKSSFALVDESDTPADYTPHHVSIRLAYDGPVLTIGRVTGRMLASDPDGTTIGIGRCTSRQMV